MKKNLLLFIFSFFFFQSFSQTIQSKNTYLKFSGGRVAFGTGDYFGYLISFDASKNIITKSKWGLSKLLLGGEMIFENGVENPPGESGTFEENKYSTFYHTSNAVLWPKVSYYPLKKILSGFNIQLGPTVGYSYRSREASAEITVDNSGSVTRASYLAFDNGVTVGYRISTGIEFGIAKKILTGFRLDWCNNTDGEINTLLGLKVGINF